MKKILIIEDDQLVANIYRSKFAAEGFQVEIAADGESGLASVHSGRPDAVVLDLMLPRLSGVDLMKKVRAEPDFEKLPIIVFSNTYLSNMVQDAWKAGATKCLSKANCSPKQLISIVCNAVQGETPNGSANGDSPTAPAGSNGHPVPANATSAHASADPKKIFNDTAPAALSALRMLLQAVIKETGAEQLKHLESMYRHAHSLTSKAALAGLNQTAHMGDAVEALIKELHDKPSNINASTLRTAASAIDFLHVLRERSEDIEKAEPVMANILVVDDEAISRRAVMHALERAKLKAVSVDNPQFAYDLICENKFDLIFLDVDMPGMNGYELCAKIRTLPTYKTMPVVFVTGLSDFETRAQSMMSGGNDLIAKPFLFMELAVKALVYVLRDRPA
jgi:CheY-like chemotaxis protein